MRIPDNFVPTKENINLVVTDSWIQPNIDGLTIKPVGALVSIWIPTGASGIVMNWSEEEPLNDKCIFIDKSTLFVIENYQSLRNLWFRQPGYTDIDIIVNLAFFQW